MDSAKSMNPVNISSMPLKANFPELASLVPTLFQYGYGTHQITWEQKGEL